MAVGWETSMLPLWYSGSPLLPGSQTWQRKGSALNRDQRLRGQRDEYLAIISNISQSQIVFCQIGSWLSF